MKFIKQENFNFIKKHTTMKTLADVRKQDHTAQKDNLNQTIVYSQQFPLTPNLTTTFCSLQIIDINGQIELVFKTSFVFFLNVP